MHLPSVLFLTKTGSMDPHCTKAIVRGLMCNSRIAIDVDTVLGDGDTRLKSAVESTKSELISDPAKVRQFPHLKHCSPTVNREYCVGHWSKNLTSHTIRTLKKYKSEVLKGSKMPKGRSVSSISRYLTTLYNSVLRKYGRREDREKMIPLIFEHMPLFFNSKNDFEKDTHARNPFFLNTKENRHMDEKSKHDSPFCVNYGKCLDELPDKQPHLRLSKTLCLYLQTATKKYLKAGLFSGMGLTMTNNNCESLNRSLRKVLPKSTHRSNEKNRDLLVCLTMLRSNHGDSVVLKILEKLNMRPHVPHPLISTWRKRDKRKLYMREYK